MFACVLTSCDVQEHKEIETESYLETETVDATIQEESKVIQETQSVSGELDISNLIGVWSHKETAICIILDDDSLMEEITGRIEMYNVDVYTLNHTPETVFESNYIFEIKEEKASLSISVPEGWWIYEMSYDQELDEITLKNEDGRTLTLFRQ